MFATTGFEHYARVMKRSVSYGDGSIIPWRAPTGQTISMLDGENETTVSSVRTIRPVVRGRSRTLGPFAPGGGALSQAAGLADVILVKSTTIVVWVLRALPGNRSRLATSRGRFTAQPDAQHIAAALIRNP